MSLSIIKIIVSFLLPGSGYFLINKNKMAFAIPLLALFWVVFISWSRLVISPAGFMSLLIGLVAIHLLSLIYCLIQYRKNYKTSINHNTGLGLYTFLLLALLLLNSSILVLSHHYKASWYGFAFYHIPSLSMAPTLRPGDVVLVDTWVYKEQTIQAGDLITIAKSKNGIVMAKRAVKVRSYPDRYQVFLQGDNKSRSIDSRIFGWLDANKVIGEIKFVWFSFANKNRFLTVIDKANLKSEIINKELKTFQSTELVL